MNAQRPRRGWQSIAQKLLVALFIVVPIVFLYFYVHSLLGDDLQRESVFAGMVAAFAGAFAAVAAWRTAIASDRAAERSARTAEDASKALALATRPDPGFNISFFTPGSVTDGTAEISLENRSQWPLADPIITWCCRGNVQGYLPLPTLPGRTFPYGGGFLQNPPPTVHEIAGIDTTRPGTDRVTVEFGTQYGPQRWTVTKGWKYGNPEAGQLGPKLLGQLETVVREVPD